MTIASEILKAQNNLKDCYDVCKSVDGVVLPEDKNFDNLPALIEQALNPFKKPSDWSDIRTDCPANSIALLAGHTTDYSQYDNLGFTANCVGGYNVFIDGTQYGSTYASGSQCNITWSSLALTTGDDITTPTTLKAHKIWITPATEGNNITDFHCVRVAESGQEVQGLLWEHFNLTNSINIQELNATGSLASSNYSNPALVACTAKDNTINFTEIQRAFLKCEKLTYVPTFNFTGSSSINASFAFTNCSLLESVILNDLLFYSASYTFHNCYKLKEVLGIKYTSARNMDYFITKSTDLKDTVVDVSSANYLKTVGCLGTSSYFMGGLKGLRVSSSAPFDATAPQINVSYTGMDRNALVQLFNDLPIVSAGQIISIVGATGASDLTADDEAIATAKGWTITK